MHPSINMLKNLLKKPKFTTEDAELVLVNCRKLIEASGSKEKYGVLNLYCNWSLHNNISGSIHGYKILQQINFDLVETILHNDITKLIKRISETLSLDHLRSDLLALLETYKIPANVLRNETNWKGISALLLGAVIEIELKYPEKENEKVHKLRNEVRQKIRQTVKNSEHWEKGEITSFQLILVDDKYIGFKLSTVGGVSYQGKLIL